MEMVKKQQPFPISKYLVHHPIGTIYKWMFQVPGDTYQGLYI